MHSQYLSPSPIFSTAAAATTETMMNSLINLPDDVLINNILLSKVHTISLLSLRCVCKYLRNLITSPTFINMHLHHSTASPNNQLNNQLVLNYTEKPEEVFYSLKFNDGGGDPSGPTEVVKFVCPIKRPQIWGSCNGLLCLTALREDDDKVYLWNPLTKEYKDLPPPHGITKVRNYVSITYGFGYDSFIDDYKIIRCTHFLGHLDGDDEKNDGNHISITEFQVYTLGTNTWRKISPDNNPYKSYFVLEIQEDEPAPFVNGALHWIMSKSNCPWVVDDVAEWAEAKIVSFDIEKEVFREIQSPFSELDNHHNFYQIRALRGYLCVQEFDQESYCNVWMMMDYGVKESWTKLFKIVQKEVEPLLVKKEDESFENKLLCYRLLRFLENDEILIKTHDILFAYDPINNKARRVEFGETDQCEYFLQTEIYIESLVSLNSGVYKGRCREFQDEHDEGSELIRAFGYINLD